MIGEKVLGLINLHERDEDFGELSQSRVRGMIPFLGRYRLIDFPLSNIVHAGIKDVGVLVPNKISSVIDHLRNAKTWDLMRNNGGLRLLVPKQASYEVNNIFKRDLEHLFTHIDFLRESNKEYVFFSGTSMISDLKVADMIAEHVASRADITIAYTTTPDWVKYGQKVMSLGLKEKRVTDVEYKRVTMDEPIHANIMKFVISRELLIDMLEESRERGETDIYKDIIFYNLEKLNVRGYEHKGYVANINSLENYFKYSMDMLKTKARDTLFSKEYPIYTKPRYEAPTIYREGAKVNNSLVSNGCKIEGTVENSIIFRGVTIEKGAVVKNSIIMERTSVGQGSMLDNVIADRNVQILPNRSIKGEKTYPTVIEKGKVI